MRDAGFFLVTGASAGIGRELARVIGASGHDLLLVARRVDRLEALAEELRDAHGVTVHVLGADLADPNTPEELYQWTEGAGLRVDALVNNAGFGAFGDFSEIDRERQLEMMRVNMTALVDLTHRFLPGMLERGGGRILNVASVASFMPSPLMAIYFATKAFVLSFTEGLATELGGTGVTATALCPGPVRTEFGQVAGMKASRFPPGTSAPRVARSGYRAMMKGKVIVAPGLVNRLIVSTVRFVPRALMRWFMLRGQRTLLRGK
jgi:uncharacterized protein